MDTDELIEIEWQIDFVRPFTKLQKGLGKKLIHNNRICGLSISGKALVKIDDATTFPLKICIDENGKKKTIAKYPELEDGIRKGIDEVGFDFILNPEGAQKYLTQYLKQSESKMSVEEFKVEKVTKEFNYDGRHFRRNDLDLSDPKEEPFDDREL